MQRACDTLRQEIEKQGISKNSIAASVGVAHTTINRYVEGKFPIDPKIARKIAKIIFKNNHEKDRFISRCAEEYQWSQENINQRKSNKSALTQVKHRVRVVVHLVHMHDWGDEAQKKMDKLKKQKGAVEAYKHLRKTTPLETEYREIGVEVDILERGNPDFPLVEFHSVKGIKFVRDLEKNEMQHFEDQQAAFATLRKLCGTKGINPLGLVEMARLAVLNSDLFKQKEDGQVVLGSATIWSWRSRLESALNAKTKGLFTGKMDQLGNPIFGNMKHASIYCDNELREVIASLRAYENQEKDLEKGQDKMLRLLSVIESAIRNTPIHKNA